MIGWNVPEQPGLNPGDQLLKGTAIDLLVSVGPELREVPMLVGLKLEDAQKLITDLGLVLVETPAAKSNAADKGLIGAQSPIPGEKVARETGIAYSISLGPDLVKLPYLVGNRLDTVQQRLQEAGCGKRHRQSKWQVKAGPDCWKISEKQCDGGTWRNR